MRRFDIVRLLEKSIHFPVTLADMRGPRYVGAQSGSLQYRFKTSCHPSQFARPQLTPNLNRLFRFNAQRIGDPCDVIEITNHLNSIVDGSIRIAARSQRIKIFRDHLMLLLCQLGCQFAKSIIFIFQTGCSPICDDPIHQSVRQLGIQTFDLSTEVMRMCLRSVGTCQFRRHDGCD